MPDLADVKMSRSDRPVMRKAKSKYRETNSHANVGEIFKDRIASEGDVKIAKFEYAECLIIALRDDANDTRTCETLLSSLRCVSCTKATCKPYLYS